jgi:hypothetical protein
MALSLNMGKGFEKLNLAVILGFGESGPAQGPV